MTAGATGVEELLTAEGIAPTEVRGGCDDRGRDWVCAAGRGLGRKKGIESKPLRIGWGPGLGIHPLAQTAVDCRQHRADLSVLEVRPHACTADGVTRTSDAIGRRFTEGMAGGTGKTVAVINGLEIDLLALDHQRGRRHRCPQCRPCRCPWLKSVPAVPAFRRWYSPTRPPTAVPDPSSSAVSSTQAVQAKASQAQRQG